MQTTNEEDLDDNESLPDFSQSGSSKKNDTLSTRFVTKNGKTFENVVPVTIDSQEIGDRFIANFLRQKLITKSAINYTHFVYPDIPDVTDFNFDQIIGKIGLPDKGRRGVLKFKVDASRWK
ncbi:hypothetical protein ABEB36_012616 [Hypothenemus hampei]|uniref:Uncharacterized protein n=1 Tax=Hypothenemus hampei TaxID=57062 RepID=A0ABD1EBX1_HYPHA